jgi:ketosteroid isomerase-like protein
MGRQLWVIGSETDEYLVRAPGQRDHILTSMYKRWDAALYAVIEAYLEGDLKPGVVEFDIESDLVAYSTAGGYLDPHIERVEATKAELVARTITPSRAATMAPGWTHNVDAVGTVIFNGRECAYAVPADLVSGDVFRIDVQNESAVDVGVTVARADWGPMSWTAPGATNALAAVTTAEEWYVGCFTSEGADLAGYPFVIASSARCDLEVPGVDPTNPASVLRAYATAINNTDVDVVCSLLADDVVMRNFFGGTYEGAGQVAEIVTPMTFDTDYESYVISDVEVSGDVVVATHEFHGAEGILRIESTRVTVVDGKIVEWVFGDPVLVASESGD